MWIDKAVFLKSTRATAQGLVIALVVCGLCLALSASARAQARHHAGDALISPLPSLTVSAVPAPSASLAGANQQVVYAGAAASDAGINVSAWGGGDISAAANQVYLSGGHSLKVVTKGPYQGGKITFASPVALGNLSSEKNRYFQLVIQVQPAPGQSEFGNSDQQDTADMGGPAVYHSGSARFQLVQAHPGGAGGMYGPPGGFGPGRYGPPGGFGPGGYGPPGGYRPGQSPQNQQDQGEENPGLPIKKMHLIFQLADGTQADVMRPVPQTDTTGWIKVAVPLSALPFPASSVSDAQLKSLIVAGDAPATIYIGEIRLLDDNTPITAIPPDEQDVAAGDEVTFTEAGDGGASSLKYTWDFDTKGSFVPQADGQTVSHVYGKAGDYKVTLVVSDLDGIKKPAIVTTVVHVED